MNVPEGMDVNFIKTMETEVGELNIFATTSHELSRNTCLAVVNFGVITDGTLTTYDKAVIFYLPHLLMLKEYMFDFIINHEVGHFYYEHVPNMSNPYSILKQDLEADTYAFTVGSLKIWDYINTLNYIYSLTYALPIWDNQQKQYLKYELGTRLINLFKLTPKLILNKFKHQK